MSRQITLTCVDCGGGHACGLAIGLKNYGQVTAVWENRNKHGLDYLIPESKYGYRHIPKQGDDLIIVSCITWDRLKVFFGTYGWQRLLKNYKKVHIIITDGRFARYPEKYNPQFEGIDVITTACKRHFREPLPVKTYYQPFDLSLFRINKNKELTIAHSPFVESKYKEKGTQEIIRACGNHHLDLITGVSWKRCMTRKAKAHIFIDQVNHYDRSKFKFKSPDYVWAALGKSGIEAMHLGCLTITHGKGYNTDIPAPPVAWVNGNVKEVLDYYINNEKERIELAAKQQAWALKYASYDFAAQQVLR